MKRQVVRSGLPLLACLLWAQSASAEVTLVEKDGWTFFTTGRIGAFVSVGFGDDFPKPTEPLPGSDPSMPSPNPTHFVAGYSGNQTFGWQSDYQRTATGKFFTMRVRSGTLSNVLGFGLRRDLGGGATATGYLAIWAPIESLGRDKWKPIDADVREGFVSIDGKFGTLTAGRMWPLLGRTSYEVDFLYGHGYGVGFPCVDAQGPTCGQVGLGALHPGYAAGLIYTSPSLAGLHLSAGIFDPVRLLSAASTSGGVPYQRVPFLRPEAALTFDTKLGATGKLKLGAEGAFQSVSAVQEEDTDQNPATEPIPVETSRSIWGVSGGLRVELGPLRIGGAGFTGKGTGLYNPFVANDVTGAPAVEQRTDPMTMLATDVLEPAHAEIRTFSGFHAQIAAVFGRAEVGVGGGVGIVGRVPSDDQNYHLSAAKQQMGLGGHVNYHLTDNVVLGADYMRFMARWYGAPAAVLVNGQPVTNGQLLAPEKQDANFVNAGVTFHW
jgi:predicted porin